MKEKLQRVIEENIALQKRAYDLNTRAGESVFPLMSHTEWRDWLEKRLNGARRISEVKDCEILRLPPLDQELIDMIYQDNPDEIIVLGIPFRVHYERGITPQIILEEELVEKKLWLDLPDEGIRLPGGRKVAVKVIIESDYYGSIYTKTEIPALKDEVRGYLNQRAWENWKRPTVEIPDLINETATIPEIEAREYGKCVVTGVPLMAYGTVVAYQIWSDEPISWEYKWYREESKAEEKRAEAVAKLDEVREEEIERRQLAEARSEAKKAKDRVCQAYLHECQNKLDPVLRDRLCDFHYDSIPSDLEAIQQWVAEAQQIYVAAEEEFAEIERKRAEWRELGIKIPDRLLKAYNGDENTAYAFMQKVAELRTGDLDEHIVCNCGRDRVRNHLIEVSGDDDFFLGADPNDVKFYIGDVHYRGENHGIPLAKTAKMSKKAEEKSKGASLAALISKWNNH